MSELIVRFANKNDINRIVEIYSTKNVKNMVDGVKYTEYDFIKHIEANNIFVCESNNIVLGFILFYNHITWVYIEIICVDIKYRKMGIGKKLFDSMNWDLMEVCCHIKDKNTIDFIEKQGFKESNQITKWYYRK